MPSFKLFCLRSHDIKDVELVKRISLPHLPTFKEFNNHLNSLFPRAGTLRFEVKWVDEDGDAIAMSTQWEWEETVSSCTSWPLRLYLNAEEVKEKHEERVDGSVGNRGAPDPMTQRILNKIISQEQGPSPKEVPIWLETAVSMGSKGLPELSIDTSLFPSSLQRRALDLLQFARSSDCEKRISLEQQAVALLRDCLLMRPEDPTVMFDLCCALSRDGEIDEAIGYLERYLSRDGSSLDRVHRHPDLKNVRQSKAFSEWVFISPSLLVKEEKEKERRQRGKREDVEERKMEKELEDMRKHEEMRKREEMRRREEMKKQEELKKREEMRKQEEKKKREEIRKREEMKREEMKRREELKRRDELKKREKMKKREEQRKQGEGKKRQQEAGRKQKRATNPIAIIQDCEEEEFDFDRFVMINHSRLETPLAPLPRLSPSSFPQVPLEPPISHHHMENPLKRKWQREIEVMEGLGFESEDLSLALLEQYKGDLNLAVNAMLGSIN